MKTAKKKKNDEMRAEYDFSKAERGKFYRPLDKGYTVHVTKKDGTVEVNHYILAEGTVLLAPDVFEYFPDSESVNEALCSLILPPLHLSLLRLHHRNAQSHSVFE